MSTALARAILEGARLSVFLEPDQSDAKAHENTYAPYAETYPLPFVFIEGDIVWGATRYSHTIVSATEGPTAVCCFYYCSRADLYAITYYSPLAHAAKGQSLASQIRTARQYDTYRMITRPGATKVWGLGDGSTKALAESVANGNEHRVVLRWSDTSAVSLPIDLVYDFKGTGRFEIRTEFTILSEHVARPTVLLERLRTGIPNYEEAVSNKYFALETYLPSHVPMYRVTSDGEATPFTGLKAGASTRPVDIAVYATP
jgi:hypothetical protein